MARRLSPRKEDSTRGSLDVSRPATETKKNDVTDRIRTCAGITQHLSAKLAGCRLNHSATVTWIKRDPHMEDISGAQEVTPEPTRSAQFVSVNLHPLGVVVSASH